MFTHAKVAVVLFLLAASLCLCVACCENTVRPASEVGDVGCIRDIFPDPVDSQLVAVAKNDACCLAIQRETQVVTDIYARHPSGRLFADFWPPCEVKGHALQSVFPKHRFFLIVWNEKVNEPPPGVPRLFGRGGVAKSPIAVDAEGRGTEVGYHGNYEDFGNFLAANKVKITSPDDAQAVWDALCEIARWKREGQNEKVSDNEWRLGVRKTPVGGKLWFEVHLNDDSTVRSGAMVAPPPPKKPRASGEIL